MPLCVCITGLELFQDASHLSLSLQVTATAMKRSHDDRSRRAGSSSNASSSYYRDPSTANREKSRERQYRESSGSHRDRERDRRAYSRERPYSHNDRQPSPEEGE